jgi:hypothetical protein
MKRPEIEKHPEFREFFYEFSLFELPTRVLHGIFAAGCRTPMDVMKTKDTQFLKTKYIGKISMRGIHELQEKIRERGHKPCPFCGGEGHIATVTYHGSTIREQQLSQDKFYYVSCVLCGANTRGTIGQANEDKAWAKWDKRP